MRWSTTEADQARAEGGGGCASAEQREAARRARAGGGVGHRPGPEAGAWRRLATGRRQRWARVGGGRLVTPSQVAAVGWSHQVLIGYHVSEINYFKNLLLCKIM
jgi:hypothetical protein